MRKSVEQRRWDSEANASKWLANGNDWAERGCQDKADDCYRKAQFWLDRANLLSNQSNRPAPKQ